MALKPDSPGTLTADNPVVAGLGLLAGWPCGW